MTAARVLNDLMALPPEERREVALRALESVDDPELAQIEEAQYQEVLRRIRDIDEGKEELIPSEVVEAELRELVERYIPSSSRTASGSSPSFTSGKTPTAAFTP